MAKNKNEGSGTFDALTLNQTDKLARRLGKAADRLPSGGAGTETALEIYDVANDLHESWMKKFHGRTK